MKLNLTSLFLVLFLFSSTKSDCQMISDMINLGFDRDLIETYEKMSEPSYKIQLDGRETYEKVGNSRIGGVPDLPLYVPYPTIEEGGETKHYVFIAQINLSELKQSKESIFPQRGMLYFFIHNDDETMSRVEHLVFYLDVDNATLHKYELDSDAIFTGTSYNKPFPAQKISYTIEKSIDLHHFESKQQDILQVNEKYHDIFTRSSRIGGHHYSVDGIISADIVSQLGILSKDENAFLTQGYLTGKHSYKESNQRYLDAYKKKIEESESAKEIAMYQGSIKNIERKIKLEEKFLPKQDYYADLVDNWKLLLVIDSIDECEMLWWDASSLEFFVNKDDMRDGDFSKTFCIINH